MSANVPGVLTGPAAQPAVPWEAGEGGPFALGVSGEGTWPAQGEPLSWGSSQPQGIEEARTGQRCWGPREGAVAVGCISPKFPA